MNKIIYFFVIVGIVAFTILSCGNCKRKACNNNDTLKSDIEMKLSKYVKVKLITDFSVLTDKEKQMLPLLYDAALIMDDLYWEGAFGNKNSFLNNILPAGINGNLQISFYHSA